MNLSISPVKNVSFGMAEFSPQGKKYADEVKAGTWNTYNDECFYKKTSIFGKPEFTKYLECKVPLKSEITPDGLQDACTTIEIHGTGTNAGTNARFTKQLIHPKTQKHIEKLSALKPAACDEIVSAERKVFDANWDNPELTKGETRKLLDAVQSTMAPEEYIKLTGVIEKSDASEPKIKKQ